jgi:hypothetical protein
MHSFGVREVVFNLMRFNSINRVPGSIKGLLVSQPIENSITAEYDKIMEIGL